MDPCGSSVDWLLNCRVAGRPSDHLWDLQLKSGLIANVNETSSRPSGAEHHRDSGTVLDAKGCLLAPSLCHPHVHLDKAFILSHPKYRDFQIKEGTFEEAMNLTRKAKELFDIEDLMQRGRRLISESVKAGVTHLRAFVEVDEIVGLKCLRAGADLKREFDTKCIVQLCAFAQLPLNPLNSYGETIRSLMTEAMSPNYLVEAVGSTPYVETDEQSQRANIDWLIELALEHGKHLDFHLDYNVDPGTPVMTHYVLGSLHARLWPPRKTVVLGHCTRLLFLGDDELRELVDMIGDLSVYFVGLPTSDMYMMKSNEDGSLPAQSSLRTTLPIPKLINQIGLNATIGMNNIGNAFTPHGSCDPLHLANLGVGLYQLGTSNGARLLYECVSRRAKIAIGFEDASVIGDDLIGIDAGNEADFVIFPPSPQGFDNRRDVEDQVYFYRADGRVVIYKGCLASDPIVSIV